MRTALLFAAVLLALGGCDDMSNQPRQKTYSPEVGPAQQPKSVVQYEQLPGTVPPVTLALLRRGQEQFRIYCTPCHSELGDGNGMVVQRGFPSPPNYERADLRNAPPQKFYDVMTKGFGVMYSFADRVRPEDRWAIASYIKALQLSQRAGVDDLSPEHKAALK